MMLLEEFYLCPVDVRDLGLQLLAELENIYSFMLRFVVGRPTYKWNKLAACVCMANNDCLAVEPRI